MLVGLFVAANLLGLLTALRLMSFEAVQTASQQHQSAGTGLWFFGLIGASTILLLLLYKYNAELLVRLWFGSAIFMTMLIFVTAWIPPLIGIVVTILLVAGRFWVDDLLIRNAFDVIAFAGAGALFGSLIGVEPAFVLLVLLALYDYGSVYVTKHMIALARAGTETDTFMGFTYPKGDGTAATSDDPDISRPAEQDVPDDAVRVGILGGGDVIIPMIFAVTLVEFSVLAALSAMTGAAIALYLLLTRGMEERFYPAIPTLATGLLAGFEFWYVLHLLL